MTDHSAGKTKSFIDVTHHVTMMAVILMLSLGPVVQCDKKEVPSEPGSSFEFEDVDLDGSGCVEGPEELQKFRLHVGRILGKALKLGSVERALRAGRITHSADVNGDGKICECDLLSILLTESEGPGLHRHAFRVHEDGSFFDDVDADDDGFLNDVSEKEAMTQKLARCVPEDKARTIVDDMSRLEKDDGQLAKSEYMLFLRSPHQMSSILQSSSTTPPQPPPSPQSQPQPQSKPQSQPQQQPQSMPQGQPQQDQQHPSPSDSQSLSASQKTSAEEGQESSGQTEEGEGRPRKRFRSPNVQPFPQPPADPAGSASSSGQPAQSRDRPEERAQPTDQAGLSGQSLSQSGQSFQSKDHPVPRFQSLTQPDPAFVHAANRRDQERHSVNGADQTVRAVSPRRQSESVSAELGLLRHLFHQPAEEDRPHQSDGSLQESSHVQPQPVPQRLEDFDPSLHHPQVQAALTKQGKQSGSQNQSSQKSLQPGHPKPEAKDEKSDEESC